MKQIEEMYIKADETKIEISLYKKRAKILFRESDKVLFFQESTTKHKYINKQINK